MLRYATFQISSRRCQASLISAVVPMERCVARDHDDITRVDVRCLFRLFNGSSYRCEKDAQQSAKVRMQKAA